MCRYFGVGHTAEQIQPACVDPLLMSTPQEIPDRARGRLEIRVAANQRQAKIAPRLPQPAACLHQPEHALAPFEPPDVYELVWRGVGEARLYENRTPEQRAERMREAVENILDEFPPR